MKSPVLSFVISPFSAIVRRYQRARLRRIMRGYRLLKHSGGLDRIAAVKQAVTELPLALPRRHFSPFLLGAAAEVGEIAARQYLFIRIGGVSLSSALLLASSSERCLVVFPMPFEWREILTQQGFKVARLKSAILWWIYVWALLLYGVVQIVRTVLSGAMSRKGSECSQGRYAYFCDLAPGNLPKKMIGSQSHDVISWYLQWPGRNSAIDGVRHGVANSLPTTVGNIAVVSQRGPLLPIVGWMAILRYALWGAGACVVAALGTLRGRWLHALLLNQAAQAAQARILPAAALAREYLFNNSGWMYRPLWTYEAEKLGAKISFYFYSTNCESFKKIDGYPPIWGYNAMTWPRYLVWDDYQADFVRRAVGQQANVSVVGTVWFQSSVVDMPKIDKPGIAVFDVTPYRASLTCTYDIENDFYSPAVVNLFLLNVSDTVRHDGMLMLWKKKRNAGRIAHPHYRSFADRLGKNRHVLLIEPEISAHRLIESSVAVISMPFTSTALIAREMGKPSIYYDPAGMLQRDDRAAHGIPILSGVVELEAWLSAQ